MQKERQIQAPGESERFRCAAKAIISQETARISAECYAESLRAVVLTGSLARDEATFVEEGAVWKLLGDADFYLVFHEQVPLPPHSSVESLAQQIQAALQSRGLMGSIGLAPVHGSYLQALQRHISSYELRCCGRVAWGDSNILSLVPAFEAAQISREDAWRLLANRIIELLEVIASLPQPRMLTQAAKYRMVKLYLDMATSYLVFAERYRPTYRERVQELKHLADNASGQTHSPFPLRLFAARVDDCTKFKLDGCGLTEPAYELWEEAVHFAQLLWTWELAQLVGTTNKTARSELMLRWMKHQPINARIRGWASVLNRSGWGRSWPQWFRWLRLGWRASPRYGIYSVGAEVFFNLPRILGPDCGNDEAEIDWRSLAARLPLLDQAIPHVGSQAWRALANVTALNYRRFLETTAT